MGSDIVKGTGRTAKTPGEGVAESRIKGCGGGGGRGCGDGGDGDGNGDGGGGGGGGEVVAVAVSKVSWLGGQTRAAAALKLRWRAVLQAGGVGRKRGDGSLPSAVCMSDG